mgnify:CR=1 FL=1
MVCSRNNERVEISVWSGRGRLTESKRVAADFERRGKYTHINGGTGEDDESQTGVDGE